LNQSKKEEIRKIFTQNTITNIGRRLHFRSFNIIRYLSEDGIDMLYNIDLKKIVAYSKRDNLQTIKKEVLENNKDKHLILDL